MKKALLLMIFILGSCFVSIYQAQAGCCFGWNNNGQSACDENVTEAECISACQAGGWYHHYYISEADCWCDGILPYSRHDGKTWCYVVVVDDCKVEDGVCKERHKLLTCAVPGGTDIDTLVQAYWVTRCTNGSCKCKDFDQNNYPGCEHTNFHYWKWCVPKKGACCAPDQRGCVDSLTQTECEALGGYYMGDGTTCDEVQCPTLTQWGLIILVVLIVFSTWAVLRRRKAVGSLRGATCPVFDPEAQTEGSEVEGSRTIGGAPRSKLDNLLHLLNLLGI